MACPPLVTIPDESVADERETTRPAHRRVGRVHRARMAMTTIDDRRLSRWPREICGLRKRPSPFTRRSRENINKSAAA
jgi:hypothetical protein